MALLDKKPAVPIYTAPPDITAIIKASTLDAILYGMPLAAVLYGITVVFMQKVLGVINLSSASKFFLQAMLVLTPVFAYRLVQVIVGIFIHPGTIPRFHSTLTKEKFDFDRKRYSANYQAMRISTLSSTRHVVDGVLVKQEAVGLKGRWMIVTPPSTEVYENLMKPSTQIMTLATHLNANILFFNYPGAGRSSGWFPNRDAVVAAHRAMCLLLEEMGATQIIDFGWSVGGGVKWRDHLEAPIAHNKYYSIDYHTFCSSSRVGEEALGVLGGQGIKFLQWEYNSEEALKRSKQPHIVVQCGFSSEVFHDGRISKDTSLAQVVEKENVVLSKEQHSEAMAHHVINTIVKSIEGHFRPNKVPVFNANRL